MFSFLTSASTQKIKRSSNLFIPNSLASIPSPSRAATTISLALNSLRTPASLFCTLCRSPNLSPSFSTICALFAKKDGGVTQSAAALYGVTFTTIVSCEPTFAENLPINFPKSFPAQRCRTLADRCSGYPRSVHETATSVSAVPRLNKITARLPSFNCFTQISLSPSFLTRRPCMPSASWLTAIISLFVRIALISGVIDRKSFPAISGAASIAHKLKCERYSIVVIPPLPTSSMSGSFQCPGPAAPSSPTCISTMSSIPSEQQLPSDHFFFPSQCSSMSPVVLHEFQTFCAHCHGFAVPHSHILNTIGRPVAASALCIVEYPS